MFDLTLVGDTTSRFTRNPTPMIKYHFIKNHLHRSYECFRSGGFVEMAWMGRRDEVMGALFPWELAHLSNISRE